MFSAGQNQQMFAKYSKMLIVKFKFDKKGFEPLSSRGGGGYPDQSGPPN